ncbi:unnamed protein product [Symbiodinium sp. CCMP2592]|nr:unnamed protein product [Symbiodinium sp. CCMP2592]
MPTLIWRTLPDKRQPAAIYALCSGCSNASDSLTLYYWGFWKMPRKMALSPTALLLALVVGAAAQQSVSLPSGRALRTKEAKCDGVGCSCGSNEDCHDSAKNCIQIGLSMKCFSDAVVHAKTKIGTFEKFADHADLADFPSALEHVSTWFIENDVGSVEELEGSDELMGKFLLASHSKVKLRPYYNMRKYLQKDLRNAPPPPPIRNPLPPLLGGTGH